MDKPLIKEVVGKSFLTTLSHLISVIQIQVGTRRTSAKAGSHSHYSRAIIPTAVEVTGGIRAPLTALFET